MKKPTALLLTVIVITFAFSTFSVQAPAVADTLGTTGTLTGER